MAQGGQQDVYVQMISAAPQPGWDPETIVSGFLLASANFTGDHAIARKYLTQSAAKAWRPGSSVAEFAGTPTATANSVQGDTVTVQVTGNLLGTLSEDGQYQAAEKGTIPGPWNFTVVRVNGQWRIANPPDELLFSKRDVNWTFRSRDLYFFDPSLSVLVPDPVYVPAEVTSQQLVAHLVEALQRGPDGWLAGATKTAFPPGTVRLGTSVTGNTATVNLGGQVRATGAQQRERMAFQLLETLASAPAYQQPDGTSIQSVVFEINGRPVHMPCATGQPPELQLSLCQPPVPPAPGSRAYYIDSKGRVATLSSERPDNAVPGPSGTGQLMFDTIAVSPDQMSVAGSSDGVLYTGGLTRNGSLTRRLAATITTLSWDSAGDLWVAGQVGGRAQVWWLDQGGRPVPVSVPKPLGPVTALRVAPDGVRVALVTGSGGGARLWLAAIVRSGNHASIGNPVPIGTDIADFTGLTWYDTGDVIALTQPPSGSELYEVPVDGGPSRPIATESGTVSIAASGDGQLVAARSDHALIQLPGPGGSIWRPAGSGQFVVHGRAPVYPG